MPVWLIVVAVLFVGVAFLLPAAWGAPAPVFVVVGVVGVIPGLLVGYLLYRRMVSRGDVPPLGTDDTPAPETFAAPEAPQQDRPTHAAARD